MRITTNMTFSHTLSLKTALITVFSAVGSIQMRLIWRTLGLRLHISMFVIMLALCNPFVDLIDLKIIISFLFLPYYKKITCQ